MKTTLKYVLSLCLLFTSTWGLCQDRNVIWVHGLNDNWTAWNHYNTIFERERQINGRLQTYNTSSGLSGAATSLKNGTNSMQPNPNNMAIGHSMGGLMIREVERDPPPGGPRFGGYITVASPNHGAQIANSIDNGKVAIAAMDGVNRLMMGPGITTFGVAPIIAGITVLVLAHFFDLNINVQNIAGSPATRNDLKENSTAINNLNNYNSTLPRISIIAEETSPVHWKLATSSDVGHSNRNYVNIANTALGLYDAATITHTVALAAFVIAFNPAAIIYNTLALAGWRRGRNWIIDSETVWNSLIKSAQLQYYTYYAQIWVSEPCPPGHGGPGHWPIDEESVLDPILESPCGYWIYEEITRPVLVHLPSDGLLPTYTQELPGATARYHIKGVNHISVLTHHETRATFNTIFNRLDWFRTP
jgi:hypothetical protein